MAESTREALHRVLQALGFKRVICVDDSYDRGPDYERILGWSKRESSKTSLVNRLKAKSINLDVSDDSFAEDFEKLLRSNVELAKSFENGIDKDNEKAQSKEREYEEPSRETVDKLVLGKFAELMEGFEDFRTYGPKEWSEKKDELVAQTKDTRTLFVFDEELGEGFPKGTDQIEALHKSTPETGCAFLLLSYVVEQGQEHDRTRELQLKGIAATAIPKRDLRNAANADFIYIRVRAAILWKDSVELRDACVQAMKDSIEPVKRRVEILTPLEFDEIIFRSSHREGIHEIDTLIRIHTNVFAAELRERLRGEPRVLREILKLRDYTATETKAQIGSAAWELQREELYEPPGYINGCNTPLEAGDIFDFEGPTGNGLGIYVLLAQPCDLMVRSKSQGQRNANVVLLAPILNRGPEVDEKGVFELPFFRNGRTAVADFSNLSRIDIRFLDFCVLNSEGTSHFKLGPQTSVLSTAWQERVSVVLTPFAQACLESLETWSAEIAENGVPTDKFPRFAVTLDGHNLIKSEARQEGDTKVLSYGIKRIERLSSGLAAEMLQAFGDHISRPARPHSLSMQGKS